MAIHSLPPSSNLLQDLYRLRQEGGPIRQPSFSADLETLARATEAVSAVHPYDLNLTQISNLMSVDSFRDGAGGAAATLPNQEYLYRICSITKALSYTSEWTSAYPRKEDLPWVAFRLWLNELERTRQWLPLGNYARGRFAGPRGFSFWTSRELSPSDEVGLMIDIHSLGIPNDWLDEYSVLLRCRTTGVDFESLLHVPTVLDGFDSHIFHATKESDRPTCGVAIKLGLTDSLSVGHNEFAVGHIPVQSIEICPVHLPVNAASYIDSHSDILLYSLRSYYAL
jgi:hypothetical protein